MAHQRKRSWLGGAVLGIEEGRFGVENENSPAGSVMPLSVRICEKLGGTAEVFSSQEDERAFIYFLGGIENGKTDTDDL